MLQIRLNFLSPLLSMSYQHLHNTLTASVLNVRLFTMPFHRDVQVTEQGAHAMLGTLAYCRQVSVAAFVQLSHIVHITISPLCFTVMHLDVVFHAERRLDVYDFGNWTIDLFDLCYEPVPLTCYFTV